MEMQLSEIFDTYFDREEAGQAYESDQDLMDNLMQALDVILFLMVNQDKMTLEEHKEVLDLVQEHIEGRLQATMFPDLLHFMQLRELDELSDWQLFCILVGTACHIDDKYEKVFAKLQSNEKARYASYGIACRLFEVSRLSQRGILMPTDIPDEFADKYFAANGEIWNQVTLYHRPLVTQKRICSWLYGTDSIPYEMSTWCEVYDGSRQQVTFLSYEQQHDQLRQLMQTGEALPVIAVEGKKGSGRRQLIRCMMSERRERVLFADFRRIAQIEQDKDKIDALFLESILQNSALCICNCTNTESMEYILQKKRRCPLFVTTDEEYGNYLSSQHNIFRITMPRPAMEDKITFWKYFLEKRDITETDPVELSNKYALNAGEINQILDYACTLANSMGRKKVQEQDVITAIRKKNTVALGSFAELLEMKAGWDDLIIEPEVRTQLQYICNRVMYKKVVGTDWGFAQKAAYGKGTCALFYGPPGTGKTMAAQVLANELGLDLYRIDISQMISKYIGETQKNISELFDKAKDSNALLFFDEADAFFAKRTEISDSNDRNANAEVAHLLQKLEGYEGISILATNLNENIDNAFKRRIKYMVRFQLPDKATRRLFWNKMLPPQAPVEEGLELEYFADHFEISGSEIKECMFHAAYMAASEGVPIGNRHIMEALTLCMGKYGKILTKDDFGYLI